MQKARGHAVVRKRHRAPTACRRTVSGTVSLPSPGYFSPFPHGTSSLSVASEYLALEDGPPRFPRDSSCPAVLGYRFQEGHAVSSTGLSPPLVVLSRDVRLRHDFATSRTSLKRPHNPADIATRSLGYFPFRSPLLRESRLISSPGDTEMFHFSPFAFHTYEFSMECCRITDNGFPHSEIPGSKPA